MPFTRLFLSLFALIFLSAIVLHAQPKPPSDFHADGIAALRKGDYPAARTAFQESLKLIPDNPTSLYNLGLVEYRAGNEGLALGLWRKALALAPGFFAPSHAIEWAEAKLPRIALGNEFSLWEQFRETFLITIPLQSYLFLVVLLLLLSGWLLLRYVGTRRRAMLDESPLPPFPWVAGVFVFLWILSIAATGAKFFDMSVTRATIVSEKVPVRTSPDNDGTALFDLIEGHEVIVRESSNDWFQVTVPGGMTGWVPKESVFVSSTRGTTP
jgi:hypothetical protein